MSRELVDLLRYSRNVSMTPQEKREQRVSFAYGNTHFENEMITRQTVQEAADRLERPDDSENGHTEG